MSILFKHKVNWKYAIGEVILIFIGITLAIAFNNWNDERKDRKQGQEYIRLIYTELNEDQALHKKISESFVDQYNGSLRILTLFDEDHQLELDTLQLCKDIITSTEGIVSNRDANSWDELNKTGRISILRDKILSDLLRSYYDLYDSSVEMYNEVPKQDRREFRSITASNLSAHDISKTVYADYTFNPELGLGGSSLVSIVLTNDKSDNLLSAIATTSVWNLGRFRNLRSEAQSIIYYMEKNYPDILNEE